MNELVMVTGANGFIGKYVVKILEGKYKIHKVTENIFDINWKEYIEKVKPKYLIHLAWITGKGYSESKENIYMVSKSIEMFDEFYKQGGKRAVFVGTEQEYKRKNEALKEKDILEPISLYAQCKCNLGEILVKTSKIYNYGFVWNRLFFIYGQGEKDARLMPSIIKAMIKGEEVVCSYDKYIRDYIYVYDVANAIVTSLFSNYVGYINICSNSNTTIGKIGNIISTFNGAKGKIRYKSHEECNQPLVIKGDNTILKSIGWKPKYSLKEGLLEEYNYYKQEYDNEKKFLE